jgi:hypothetical protein
VGGLGKTLFEKISGPWYPEQRIGQRQKLQSSSKVSLKVKAEVTLQERMVEWA